jgi:PAS domain S-box-containing protein
MLDPARRPTRRPQVLCVDDDAVLALMIRDCLLADGYEVFTAGDVAAARGRLRDGPPPDLVVLDALLPDGRGIAFCRELKNTPGWEGVPVLIVTGLSDETSIAEAYAAGAADYVTKPLAWEVLRHRVGWLIRAGQERHRLEEYETQVAGLMAMIEEAVLSYEAAGRIESFAPSAVRMFGLPAKEAWGRPVRDLFPDELPEATDEMAYKTVRARRANGTEFVADVSVHRVRDRDAPLTLLVARDVTDRAAAEGERRAFEERARVARQRESLVALSGGVAHELNSALTAVLGYTEAARLRSPDEAVASDLRHAEAAIGRARRLVDQLLAYAGRARPQLRPADLNGMVGELPEMAAGQIGRAVRLTVESAAHALPVRVDADQLGQALIQLVLNAVEAAGDDSPVTVRTGRESLEPGQLDGELAAGEYAYVEVADAGPGMAPDVLARAIEPFFTTHPIGRGLGLSVVAGVVKSHGGALRIQSEPRVGTTVRIWLPQAADEPPPAGPGRLPPGTRVLVVDDEDLVRSVIKAMLERKGCEVLLAANGREGVDLFRQEGGRIDAVLLDLNMPVLDGERALEELRNTSPTVPVWIMTGYDPADREDRLAKGTVRGVLRKPVSSETLYQALAAALGS